MVGDCECVVYKMQEMHIITKSGEYEVAGS